MSSRLITNVAEELLPKNSLRQSFIVQNEDAAIAIYVKFERSENTTVSSSDHDHRIGPGGNLALNYATDGLPAIQGRWTVISEPGNPRISFFETESIQR